MHVKKNNLIQMILRGLTRVLGDDEIKKAIPEEDLVLHL